MQLCYKADFRFGVHNYGMKDAVGSNCMPGELFLMFEVTIENKSDGSLILYRTFSPGVQSRSGHYDKKLKWQDVPQNPEQRIILRKGNLPIFVAPQQQLLLPQPFVQPLRRRKIFKPATVESWTGNFDWDHSTKIYVNFEGANPPPRDQEIVDITFGKWRGVVGKFETPNTLVFNPTAVKDYLRTGLGKCQKNADKTMLLRVILKKMVNGRLPIDLSYTNLSLVNGEEDNPQAETIRIWIPFYFPGYHLPLEEALKILCSV